MAVGKNWNTLVSVLSMELPAMNGSQIRRREVIGGLGATAIGAICQPKSALTQPAAGFTHRTINTNGIRLHVVEQGEGPLVLMCHGFPESWYSWRHQLAALSAAGFRAVAADMRGYGQSERPESIDQYTLLHLVGDMVGLLDALGVRQAVIAGHNWGAVVAWYAALLRPDRFRAVIALSLPYLPRSTVAPTSAMPRRKDSIFSCSISRSRVSQRPNLSATSDRLSGRCWPAGRSPEDWPESCLAIPSAWYGATADC